MFSTIRWHADSIFAGEHIVFIKISRIHRPTDIIHNGCGANGMDTALHKPLFISHVLIYVNTLVTRERYAAMVCDHLYHFMNYVYLING